MFGRAVVCPRTLPNKEKKQRQNKRTGLSCTKPCFSLSVVASGKPLMSVEISDEAFMAGREKGDEEK